MSPGLSHPRVRVSSPAGVLAVIPHLFGFTPRDSLVVLGTSQRSGQVEVALRFDLPDPPEPGLAADVAAHVTGMLTRQRCSDLVAVGYGPGRLVTPLADAFLAAVPHAGLWLRELLRAEDGMFWSYLCQDPACCPASGAVFDPATHPAGVAMAAAGKPVLSDRGTLAATIAPVTGRQAAEMAEATRHAERAAASLADRHGTGRLERDGLAAVRAAVRAYRQGGSVTSAARHASLALALTRLRVRDDAWARMDPAHREEHRRLWTDVTRRAQPGYAAAPASLLAFTAWQTGDGALANLALDRALADTPGYSMAVLLRDVLDAGVPPSEALPVMTPAEVAASYATPGTRRGGPDGPAARHG